MNGWEKHQEVNELAPDRSNVPAGAMLESELNLGDSFANPGAKLEKVCKLDIGAVKTRDAEGYGGEAILESQVAPSPRHERARKED